VRLYLATVFGRHDLTPGAIGFLQTAGELLGFHPHLHVLLADGAWLPDGTFRHLLYLDASQVEKLFRAEVLRLLVERGKIGDEVVQSLLAWRHSGFSVDASVRVEERSEAARLGRTMIRCPLVLERLSWDQPTGEVVYHARPGRRDGCRRRRGPLGRAELHRPDPGPPAGAAPAAPALLGLVQQRRPGTAAQARWRHGDLAGSPHRIGGGRQTTPAHLEPAHPQGLRDRSAAVQLLRRRDAHRRLHR
jgi:hypothetical protein